MPETFGVSFSEFTVKYEESLPAIHPLCDAILLPYPEAADQTTKIPACIPFLAAVNPEYMEQAFESGACECINRPVNLTELRVRISRLMGTCAQLPIPGTSLYLSSHALCKAHRKIPLHPDEERVLRILLSNNCSRVSRKVLLNTLWPELSHDSRLVDNIISRLRKHFLVLCDSEKIVQIRSIRRFGYQILSFPSC